MAVSSKASINYLLEKTFRGRLTRERLLGLICMYERTLHNHEFRFNDAGNCVYFAKGEWFPFISFVEKNIDQEYTFAEAHFSSIATRVR